MDKFSEYLSNHPWLVAMAAAAAMLVVIYEIKVRRDSFAAISPQDLIHLQNKGGLVIDLRTLELFTAGHISGAIQMDSAAILSAHRTLQKHQNKPVIVYCESGSTGASAVRVLTEQGFKQAFNLRNGLGSWRSDNLPLS